MKLTIIKLRILPLLVVAASFPSWAASSSGTITATLTLTNGCLINGSPSQSGINFGTLDFGSHTSQFSNLDGTLSSGGGSTFGVQCTVGTTYTVTMTNSTNTAPATVTGTVGNPARYLVNTTDNGQGIAYSLYSDAGKNNVIANGATLTKVSTTSGVDNYTLYGGISGNGVNASVKAGTYTDVINVTVAY